MSENPSENVFELISNNYYELTASEKKIADYIIADPEHAQQIGIADLAEACGTAMATISRFSRKLGYDGFNAMRIAIAHAVSSKSGSASHSRISSRRMERFSFLGCAASERMNMSSRQPATGMAADTRNTAFMPRPLLMAMPRPGAVAEASTMLRPM